LILIPPTESRHAPPWSSIETNDKARGYETLQGPGPLRGGRGRQAIVIPSTHTMDIDSASLRDRQALLQYVLLRHPRRSGRARCVAVIRDEMRSKTPAALRALVLAKRERVIAREPWTNALSETLRYPYDVRSGRTILPTSGADTDARDAPARRADPRRQAADLLTPPAFGTAARRS
jgi:non-homologous end joining protein Ku